MQEQAELAQVVNTQAVPSCSHCQARWEGSFLPSTDAGQPPRWGIILIPILQIEAEAEDHTVPKLERISVLKKPRPPGSESPNYSKVPAQSLPGSAAVSQEVCLSTGPHSTPAAGLGPSPHCPSPRSASPCLRLHGEGLRGTGPTPTGAPHTRQDTSTPACSALPQLQTCALTPLCGAQGGDVPAETARTVLFHVGASLTSGRLLQFRRKHQSTRLQSAPPE